MGPVTSGNIVAIVAVLGLLITAAAVVGGSFRVSHNTATVMRYKEASESWEAKASAQEQKIEVMQDKMTALQTALAEKDTIIGELQGRITVLQELVTGRNAVDELAHEHDQFITAWEQRSGETLQQIASIRAETRAIHEKLNKMAL